MCPTHPAVVGITLVVETAIGASHHTERLVERYTDLVTVPALTKTIQGAGGSGRIEGRTEPLGEFNQDLYCHVAVAPEHAQEVHSRQNEA